jgi:transposase
MDVTDKQWSSCRRSFLFPHVNPRGAARPWREAREVLDGILWVLWTGAPRSVVREGNNAWRQSREEFCPSLATLPVLSRRVPFSDP